MPSPSTSTSQPARWLREPVVFAGFCLLTALMTWPWAAQIRDATPDAGDPYLNSWILWWDWHQTFTDPLNLFHGNVFFPLSHSLAFSEHNYGIALPLFPLFAAGVRPLTVHGLAMLLGYALSGYGAFRLARTLTGSTGAGWVAGIGFAFVPYRFQHISHVNYTSAGWVPLLLEALVLFVRARTWKRAAWLSVAFLMNGLTCIHWLVLSAVPLALSGVLLAFRQGVERDRAFLRRGAVALGAAGLGLLPFLLPYREAARLYGFVRTPEDAAAFSAGLGHWLTADPRNRLWSGFGEHPAPGELALFPGLLLLLLSLAALLLARPAQAAPAAPPDEPAGRRRGLLLFLDAVSVAAGTIALLASAPSGLRVHLGEALVFRATDPARALLVLGVALLVRWSIAWPRAFAFASGPNLPAGLRGPGRPDAFGIGLVFLVTGFLGSLGMRTPFHRVLFEALPPFRSIRVPARWAMMADLGLAVLAGLGALLLASAAAQRWPARRWLRPGLLSAVSLLLLLEDRAAPLDLMRGAVDPDELTLFLARTPMRGGLVHLPPVPPVPYEAMLRAADHQKPLVNAVSGFVPPAVARLEELTARRPIPDETLDLLESIPASYLALHDGRIDPRDRPAWRDFLLRGMESGRLRFVGRFDGRRRNDLYAVTRTEPDARSLGPLPWIPAPGEAVTGPGLRADDLSLIGSIDEPAPDGEVKGTLLVRGWARVPGEDLTVTIVVDGEARAPASFQRVPRPDVARVLPETGDTSASGYEARFDFQPGDGGVHELFVVFAARDGRVRRFPSRRFEWSP